MKGKPLIERIVPGITFQIQKTDYLLLDVNPVIRYKVTGRFTAGAGWNERLSFDGWKLKGNVRVYGTRVVTEYKWGRGFHFLFSPELMNTEVPPQLQTSPEEHHREWIFGAFVGLKKEFKIYKKIMGNTEFLYNMVNTHGKSPYQDRISLRFGFEFPMRKKSAQKSVMALPSLRK